MKDKYRDFDELLEIIGNNINKKESLSDDSFKKLDSKKLGWFSGYILGLQTAKYEILRSINEYNT